MSTDTLQDIEKQIADAKTFSDLGESLVRLSSNRDFRKVIVDGYLSKEAVRLVHLKADPAMQKPESQESIVRQIDAIGALSSYFRTVEFQATLAVNSIASAEAAREEILAEEIQA